MAWAPVSELLLCCPNLCFSGTHTESRIQTSEPMPPGGGEMTPRLSGAGGGHGFIYKRTTAILSKAVEVTALGKGVAGEMRNFYLLSPETLKVKVKRLKFPP